MVYLVGYIHVGFVKKQIHQVLVRVPRNMEIAGHLMTKERERAKKGAYLPELNARSKGLRDVR